MGSQLEDTLFFKIIQSSECNLHMMSRKRGGSSCSGAGYLTVVLISSSVVLTQHA